MKGRVTRVDNRFTNIPTRLTLSAVRVVSVLSRVENLKVDTTPYYKKEWVDYDFLVEPASASMISRVDEEWEEFAKDTYYNAEPEESTLEFVEVETV